MALPIIERGRIFSQQNPTAEFRNTASVDIIRSGTYGMQLNGVGVEWVNFIGGFAAVLKFATFVAGQQISVINTSPFAGSLALDNGGTVAGVLVYTVPGYTSSNPIVLRVSGSNLIIPS